MTMLFILGGGGFASEVAMICQAMKAAGSAPFDDWRFLDDYGTYLRERGRGDQLAGPIAGHAVDPDALYICAIGDPAARRSICDPLEARGATFTRIIHPVSQVADSAQIGPGTVIAFGGGVYPFAKVGRHVHINAHSGLGHDAEVGNYVTLSSHVDLTGFVKVGDEVFFGTHASVLPKKVIGNRARIGAGCVVTRSIRDDAILYVQPPRFLSRGSDAPTVEGTKGQGAEG